MPLLKLHFRKLIFNILSHAGNLQLVFTSEKCEESVDLCVYFSTPNFINIVFFESAGHTRLEPIITNHVILVDQHNVAKQMALWRELSTCKMKFRAKWSKSFCGFSSNSSRGEW